MTSIKNKQQIPYKKKTSYESPPYLYLNFPLAPFDPS